MYKREPNCTEVILHNLLRVLEVNSKTLPMVLESGYNLTKLTTLYLFFNTANIIPQLPQFLSFMGSLSYLTHLKLSNCCTDQLLAVIGINCKSLEVLDAEEDSEMMTTDHGLAFLSNCSKLTTIILNDAGDEYDYEDRYFGITGKFVPSWKKSAVSANQYILSKNQCNINSDGSETRNWNFGYPKSA